VDGPAEDACMMGENMAGEGHGGADCMNEFPELYSMTADASVDDAAVPEGGMAEAGPMMMGM